ncbi:HNH endonuclease signature motif containing protein [Rhodococcus sp. 1168]|uniref:HNH endonuclease signature motif containing protein n=1 Tax=Rhodococcus sp. 1168 TaxID=2018041 RepID=UPI000F740502|nr:HNH endonuclease signature motif containing protein [Rhodococcus sp. 1168]
MFGSGFIDTTDQAVGGMLYILTECASAENVRRGRLVEAVCEILDRRLADAEECGGDPSECHREVLCEISTQLTVSLSTGRTLLDTSEALNHLPLTALRLIFGGIDWARVVVLASVLGKASARTVKVIEFQALAAAESMAPRRLRNRVWSLWMQFAGAEATAAQTEAKAKSTGVNIHEDGTGMSVLRAQMSDLQGAEAEALISEIAATVCKKDPRTGQQRRLDGLLASLYGERALACRCEFAEECSAAGVAEEIAPRRGHLLNILIDVETLLGLSSTPATLPDGTALDPDLVRMLAQDARWQAILTELVEVLEVNRGGSTGSATETGSDETRERTALPTNDEEDSKEDNSVETVFRDCGHDNPVAEQSDPGSNGTRDDGPESPLPRVEQVLRRILGRGRVRGPAEVPRPGPHQIDQHTSGEDSALRRYVDSLLREIEHDPSKAAGVFPDGHGGLENPPPGALPYRPSRAVASMVRMAYRTCTFSSCDTPSSRCQLDHIVPFDHDNPRAGGWTVGSNLHPVCICHHQAKTARMWPCAMLSGGAILWTGNAGSRRITLPGLSVPNSPPLRVRKRHPVPPETRPDGPTWWEKHMPPRTHPPSRSELARAGTDEARSTIRELRRRFREHRAVEDARERRRPAPY